MIRRFQFLAFTFLFVIPLSAAAEVQIAPVCRVKNLPPGRCGWCAVETLARHLQIEKLHGITETHACRSNLDDLEGLVAAAGISYRLQRPGSFSTGILADAVARGLGVAVGFKELRPGAGGHIVTLIDFTDKEVRVIDPNDQDGRTRTMSRERFLYWWDGMALVLEREATTE
jgi:ABC-type bacteriocin/lantibiotic exporter with double-glycine peptidase domain